MPPSPVVTAAAATIAVASVLYGLTIAFLRRKEPRIPGPFTWPIFGDMFLIISYTGRFHDLRSDMRRKYGPIYRLRGASGRSLVTVSDADAAKKLLTSDSFLRSGRPLLICPDIFKSVLFFMPTDTPWRKHRKFLQPGFGPTHLRHSLVATNEAMDNLLNIWELTTSGNATHQTDIYHVASSITIDVIGVVAFSYRYACVLNHLDPDSQVQMKAYQSAFDAIARRFATPSFLWRAKGLAADQIKGQVDEMKSAVRNAITSKRELMRERGAEGGDKDEAYLKKMRDLDVLDRMMESSEWNDEEMTDEVLALFLAGGETSANTIVNCALLLDAHPEVLDRMVMELDEVLDDSEGDHVTWDQLQRLKYTECVVKESLRVMPVVVNSLGRIASEDVEIMGHVFPKGSTLSVDIQGIHRDERYWKHPMSFSPSRFMDGFTPAPGTYVPFGDGIHMCIGYKMAMIELKGVLARIYKKYRLSVVHGQDMTRVTTITTGFKNGLKVVVERRKKA
ncbi:Thromboxane-A synthase [Irineochytrium annulatum]|nr:Thromboxane-A synthase [Irineochytrium annulatum]